MEVGKRIKEIRLSRKLTARELSEKCGVPEKSIYKIESGGVKDPRLSSVVSISKGLGCSVDELLNDVDVDLIANQMIDVVRNAESINEVTKNYLIQMLEDIQHNESVANLMNNPDNNVPKEVAEDYAILRRLELKRSRTREEEFFMESIKKEYGWG